MKTKFFIQCGVITGGAAGDICTWSFLGVKGFISSSLASSYSPSPPPPPPLFFFFSFFYLSFFFSSLPFPPSLYVFFFVFFFFFFSFFLLSLPVTLRVLVLHSSVADDLPLVAVLMIVPSRDQVPSHQACFSLAFPTGVFYSPRVPPAPFTVISAGDLAIVSFCGCILSVGSLLPPSFVVPMFHFPRHPDSVCSHVFRRCFTESLVFTSPSLSVIFNYCSLFLHSSIPYLLLLRNATKRMMLLITLRFQNANTAGSFLLA